MIAGSSGHRLDPAEGRAAVVRRSEPQFNRCPGVSGPLAASTTSSEGQLTRPEPQTQTVWVSLDGAQTGKRRRAAVFAQHRMDRRTGVQIPVRSSRMLATCVVPGLPLDGRSSIGASSGRSRSTLGALGSCVAQPSKAADRHARAPPRPSRLAGARWSANAGLRAGLAGTRLGLSQSGPPRRAEASRTVRPRCTKQACVPRSASASSRMAAVARHARAPSKHRCRAYTHATEVDTDLASARSPRSCPMATAVRSGCTAASSPAASEHQAEVVTARSTLSCPGPSRARSPAPPGSGCARPRRALLVVEEAEVAQRVSFPAPVADLARRTPAPG